MRGWRLGVISILLILLILAVSACGNTQNQNLQQQISVLRGNLIIKANGSGRVNFEADAEVNFGTGGKIAKLYVKEGDLVAKGTILAQLETDNLELALSQAKVAAAQAQKAVSQAEIGVTQTEIALTQAQVGLTQAQSALTGAQFNLDRIHAVGDLKDEIMKLQMLINATEVNRKQASATGNTAEYKYLNTYLIELNTELDKRNSDLQKLLAKDEYTNVAPYEIMIYDPFQQTYNLGGQTYDRLIVEDIQLKQQQVTLAQKGVESAQQNIGLANQNIDVSKQTVEQTKLTVDQANKAVVVAEKQIKDASIYAPIDGYIVDLNVREGDVVSGTGLGTNKLVYILNTSRIHISAQIDEIDIASVKEGQHVIIHLDSAPDVTYDGTVRTVSLVPMVNVQNAGVVVYEVKTDFTNPLPASIKLGMSATVDIVTNQRANVLLIPSRVIKEDADGNPVVDVLVNGKTETRKIQLGLTNGIDTEILGGLSENDILIYTRTAASSLGMFGQ